MARAWLADDLPYHPHQTSPGVAGWGVALDGDPGSYGIGAVPAPVGDTLDTDGMIPTDNLWALKQVVIRARTLVRLDADDNPVWSWTKVFDGLSEAVADVRTEVSDQAGMTAVTATVTIEYTGATPITETAVLTGADGAVWRITSVLQSGSRCLLQVARDAQQSYTLGPDDVVVP